MKKIGALLLAIIMIMSVSVAAMAADSTPGISSGTAGSTGSTASITKVTVNDVLKVFNPDETEIYAPNVSFAFAIAAATDEADGVGTTVTDSEGVQANILAGNWSGTNSAGNTIRVAGEPTITTSFSYSSAADTVAAAADGAENIKKVEIDFSGVTFPKAGIYRYKVTRTVTDDNMIDEDTDNERYLDVYVKEDNGSRLIYGYAFHHSKDSVTTNTTKSNGFDDEYHTSNLTVEKKLVNDSSNNSHKFPFRVAFSDTKGAHISTKEVSTNKATVTPMDDKATESEPTIAHEGKVKYYGIPDGFTAEVYETNDVIGTSYKSKGTADTAADEKTIVWSGEGANSNTAKTDAAVNKTKEVSFTNTLDVISPTGVVLRVAPYVMILAAGLVLLLISRKRRADEE